MVAIGRRYGSDTEDDMGAMWGTSFVCFHPTEGITPCQGGRPPLLPRGCMMGSANQAKHGSKLQLGKQPRALMHPRANQPASASQHGLRDGHYPRAS